MRSLSTKVTKTYDIDITLIWVQLHVILFNFVWIYTGKNVYEPRSDRRDLLAIKVKSEIFTEKEKASCCDQFQTI